ncbi:hypothetical protein BaRGS_00009671 [Batillaria attramentaria]|uniref:Mevalonate kinase n=1 Tax=Batillaria attramentaria TaxID=370345 RepID=A0ABD0LI04_9CAEN
MEEIVVSAPGKVILHGEHSVVYGKVAVASSLNLRCYLRLVPNDDGLISLDLPNVDVHQQWSVDRLRKELMSKIHIQGVNCTAMTIMPPGGLYQLSGTRTQGSLKGDSSSEPVPPCDEVMKVLKQFADIGSEDIGTDALAGCGDVETVGWSDTERALINQWAFVGEKIIHGQPSGIDNSISALGGAIRFQKKQITPVEKMPSLRVLLTNTKVPRSTKTLVASVGDRYRKYTAVMSPILDAMEGVAEKCLQVYADLQSNTGSSDAYTQLEELIDINQSLLGAIGVGHATLDKIVLTTARYGLHTKLTGAGGGGCTYTLLRPDVKADTVNKVCQELRQAGFDCWETSIGGPGVLFHSNPSSDSSIPCQLFA